jgi:hypothetical protein
LGHVGDDWVEESDCFLTFPIVSFVAYLFVFFFERETGFCCGGPYFLVREVLLVDQEVSEIHRG